MNRSKKVTPGPNYDADLYLLSEVLKAIGDDAAAADPFVSMRNGLASKTRKELNPQQRALVRDTIQSCADAAREARGERAPKRRKPVAATPADAWSKEVRCGALPKYPPGMTAESRRGGEWRR